MRFVSVAFAFLLLVGLCGCSGRTLVGSWKSTAPPDTTLKFENGGKFTVEMSIDQLPGVKMSANGDYAVAEEKITMTTRKIDMSGEIPGMLKAMVEAQIKDAVDKPVESTLVWNSNDEIKIKMMQQEQTFVRQK